MNDRMSGNHPENWEASDHIENLKRGLGTNEVCAFHDDSTRSQIWVIHHVDLLERSILKSTKPSDQKSNGSGVLNWVNITSQGVMARGWPAILIAFMIMFVVFQWYQGKRIERKSEEIFVASFNKLAVAAAQVEADNDRREATGERIEKDVQQNQGLIRKLMPLVKGGG